jgi:hypothetical protein
MTFEDMQVPLEIQRLALETIRERGDRLAGISLTSCHDHSCAAAQVADAETLSPGVQQPEV